MSEYEGKYDPIDFVGRKIRAGDLVVYPVRRRSTLELKKARVGTIRRRGSGHTIEGENERGHRVTLLHTDRLIVIGDEPC